MSVNRTATEAMKPRTLQVRLSRLEALSARLSDGTLHAVAALAEEFGVSQRTLARDLTLLREQGWELKSSSGRGGGIQITQRWSSGRMTLRSDDALELLMALALSEALGLSPARRHAQLRRQLGRCFAPADRTDIARLRKRIRVASPASVAVQGSLRSVAQTVRSNVYDAFAKQWLLSIRYIDAQQRTSQRIVEAQCLLLAWPFWYVLAWDTQREAVRTFRLDRIIEVRRLNQRFQLRAADSFWAACGEIGVMP
jgi:predicted DNA-binding transcriptional regulator YafY